MNVLIYRLPREISIVTPPSSCPSCSKKIRFYDNIPFISWLLLGGKCRHCKATISIMYPATEILTGVLFLLSYLRFGLGWELALACCLIFTALSAGLADLFSALDTDNFECGIIPDSLVLFGLVSGFLTSYMVHGDILFPVYGAAVGFAGLYLPSKLYELIRKREGMGFGDVKLVAVFGAFLGLKSVFFLIFFSALIGAAVGIVWQILSGKKNMMIPFGPFISASAIIYLFFETVVNKILFGA